MLVDRILIALCSSLIAAVMAIVAGGWLRDSARSRNSLTNLLIQREQLLRQMSPNIPRIF